MLGFEYILRNNIFSWNDANRKKSEGVDQMNESEEKNSKKTVTVRITAQQRPLLDRVLAKGSMGNSESEVIRRAFLEWAKGKLVKGKRNG